MDTVNVASAAIVSGQLYLSLSNGLVINCGQAQGPQGLQGPPGPPGPNGRAGIDGTAVLHGPGLPLPTDGKQGDFYVDTADLTWYGPKTGAGWGSGVALRGSPRDLVLPNGMKAQQGDPIYPRVFAGAMAGGGGGGTVVIGGSALGTAATIIGHNQPLAAGEATYGPVPIGGGPAPQLTPEVWTTIAADSSGGDAMIVDVFGESAGGAKLVEVAVMRDSAKATGYSEVYEVRTGMAPPTLSFRAGSDANGQLILEIKSSANLRVLRGRILYI